MDEMHKQAMRAVLEDMGRAAREGRSRRFTDKPKKHGVDVTMGEVTLEPGDKMHEPEMSDADMKDLADLAVER